jgi:cytoskeleton protein RodZ
MAGRSSSEGRVQIAESMKTDAPSVPKNAFSCASCGARLDAAHLDPGYPGVVCTFCGAHLPDRTEPVLVPDLEQPSPGRSKRGMDVGETLREAREGRGQSLIEAARATRIKQEYLRELEDGLTSFEPYPGRIYGRFFLREYADHLGLDAKPLLRAFDADGSTEFAPTLPVSLSRRPPRRRRWAIAAALVLVALLVGTSLLRRASSDTNATFLHSPNGGRSAVSHSVQPSPPPAGTVAGIHAVLTFKGRCWVQADADGTLVVSHTFVANQGKRMDAKHDLTIHLGSGGAARLTVNGHPVQTGAVGQPADVHIEWQNGKLILP